MQLAGPSPPVAEDRESGLAVVEWILLLLAVILPMAALIFEIMKELEQFYSITGWVVGLPFP
jgi:hypothetical protein